MTDLSHFLGAGSRAVEALRGAGAPDAIIYDEVPADSDPLGPDNKLVFAPWHARRNDCAERRPSVSRREEPADRWHQGVELRRSGGSRIRAARIAAVVVDRRALTLVPATARDRDRPHGGKLERVDAWAGAGNYEVVDAIKAIRPEGDRYATITNGPAGEALARRPRHRASRIQGLSEPVRRARRPWCRHGQQGTQGDRRLGQGRRAGSSTPTKRRSSRRPAFSAAIKEHGVSGTGCRCTEPTC